MYVLFQTPHKLPHSNKFTYPLIIVIRLCNDKTANDNTITIKIIYNIPIPPSPIILLNILMPNEGHNKDINNNRIVMSN